MASVCPRGREIRAHETVARRLETDPASDRLRGCDGRRAGAAAAGCPGSPQGTHGKPIAFAVSAGRWDVCTEDLAQQQRFDVAARQHDHGGAGRGAALAVTGQRHRTARFGNQMRAVGQFCYC